MSLSQRAIAQQGIGYAMRLVALQGFGDAGGNDGAGLRFRKRAKPLKPRPPIYRHPEEVEREQEMLAEYLRELEKKAKHRAGARERKKAGQSAPHLTDAMARAASAEQLQTIAGAATAALLDRHKAAEEQRRRGLMAILLLALD